MTDRELLELAAKAAGIELRPMEVKNVSFQGDDKFIGYMCEGHRGWWNPLTDDGDALRLAVKLKMDVSQDYNGDDCVGIDHWKLGVLLESNGDDTYAATRLAIVRAAAEIGKDMK